MKDSSTEFLLKERILIENSFLKLGIHRDSNRESLLREDSNRESLLKEKILIEKSLEEEGF